MTEVRPMTAADYREGEPIAVRTIADHPIRDLVLAAVLGAAALWAVPRVLDRVADEWLGEPEDDGLELDLEDELAAEGDLP